MPEKARVSPRMTLLDLLLLTAGEALALWLLVGWQESHAVPDESTWLNYLWFGLGGLSLVGPPLLLWRRRRGGGRKFRVGELLWFCQGTASWLLWPPAIYAMGRRGQHDSMAMVCYFYGTPLMALYVVLSLLAGGWLGGRRRRRRRPRSWTETFGLLLGLAWACTGLYVLSIFYRQDFLK